MKTNSTTKFLLFILFIFLSINTRAQVTIGSGTTPVKGALLDIKEWEVNNPGSLTDDTNISAQKGLSLPRVKLVNKKTLQPLVQTNDPEWITNAISKIGIKHAGVMVYNIYESVPTESDPDKVFTAGIYVWDGTQWEKANDNSNIEGMSPYLKFFYMPSVVFDTSTIVNMQNKDLYQLYVTQFGAPKYKNPSAPASIPFVPARTDLNYYITDYDTDVFDLVLLTDDGLLIYNVKKAATAYSLINIVFVLK